jgi:hypothetical protein
VPQSFLQKRQTSKVQTVSTKKRGQTIGVLKWGTTTLASVLFMSMFAVYGWTVSLEQRGADLYDQLTDLREAEKGMRNMTKGLAMDAAAKNTGNQYLPGRGSIVPLPPAPPRAPLAVEAEPRPVQHRRLGGSQGY